MSSLVFLLSTRVMWKVIVHGVKKLCPSLYYIPSSNWFHQGLLYQNIATLYQSLIYRMSRFKGDLKTKKNSVIYLTFRPCIIMFSTFFLAYPLFFHLKKCFYSDFGPIQHCNSEWRSQQALLQLMMYDMGKTCESAP